MAARKPTPVDVVYFPKRPRVAPAVTQTIPEAGAPAPVPSSTPTVLEMPAASTAPTEVAVPVADERGLAEMTALGHELFAKGRVNEARVVFEGLVVSNPLDAFAHTMLGTVHLARRDHEAAMAAFERALSLDPDDVAARVYRGELRLNKKRVKAATDDLNWALKVADQGDPFAERARRLLKLARKSSRGS